MDKESKGLLTASYFATLLQWLEYASYGVLASTLAIIFAPNKPYRAVVFASILLITASYLIQPLSLKIYHYLKTQHGKLASLTFTICFMALISWVLRMLPSVQHLAIIAPALLIVCRLMQGHAFDQNSFLQQKLTSKDIRRYFPHMLSCNSIMATTVGVLLGAIIAVSIDHHMLTQWAWRIPFIIAAVTFIANMTLHFTYGQNTVEEFDEQAAPVKHSHHWPMVELGLNYKAGFIKSLVISGFIVVYLSICALFFHSFLVTQMHYPASDALTLIAIGSLCLIVLLPTMAYTADRLVSTRTMMYLGLLGTGTSALLMFMLAPMHSTFAMVFSELFFALFTACATAPLIRIQSQLFPTRVRSTALSASWCLSLAAFGTSTPAVSYYLITQTHVLYAPALIACLAALVAIIIVAPMKSSNSIEIDETALEAPGI